MQLIKKLSAMIEDELDDAEKYVRCALNHKEDRRPLAETFYALSLDELKHMNQLHEFVVRLIDEVRQSGTPVPEGMMEMYEYLHERHIEHEKEIRILQKMYTG